MAGAEYQNTLAFTAQMMGYQEHRRSDWFNRIWLVLVVPAMVGIAAALILSPLVVLYFQNEWKPISRTMLMIGMFVAGVSIPFALRYWWRNVNGADEADFIFRGLNILFDHYPAMETPEHAPAVFQPIVTKDGDHVGGIYTRLRASIPQQKRIAEFLMAHPKSFSGRKLAQFFGRNDERAAYAFINSCVDEKIADDLGNKYVVNADGWTYFAYILHSPTPLQTLTYSGPGTAARAHTQDVTRAGTGPEESEE